MRKIIQIACTTVKSSLDNSEYGVIYALCDDGTLWVRNSMEPDYWFQIYNVPQPRKLEIKEDGI